jgi:ABC-type transport system involved in multi-copper enzyme maturation permease subunit
MEHHKKVLRVAILVTCIICGTVIPFVDYLALIEVFYLSIPFALVFFASLAYLIGRLIFKGQKDGNALFLAFLMPTFIASQILAGYIVDKVQRFRSEQIIKEIEATHSLPLNQETFGVKIVSAGQSNAFQISYSRGFMTREVYNSSSKTWNSKGWND